MYIKDIQQGTSKKDGIPKILKETSATAWVDGNALLGPVVGKFCMELAIKKAKESGVGWVVAKGSNHFGIAGYYSMMALSHKLLVNYRIFILFNHFNQFYFINQTIILKKGNVIHECIAIVSTNQKYRSIFWNKSTFVKCSK